MGVGESLRPYPNKDNGRWLEWSFIMANLPEKSGRVLDLGCGDGCLSAMMSLSGHTVIGIDTFPVEYRIDMPNLWFTQCDVLLDGINLLPFDVIVACSTVEHIGLSGRYGQAEDGVGDIKAMVEMGRKLREGGYILLTVPVGKDDIIRSCCRIYGRLGLHRLLHGFDVLKDEYWHKVHGKVWERVSRDLAIGAEGNAEYSALGTFKLKVKDG